MNIQKKLLLLIFIFKLINSINVNVHGMSGDCIITNINVPTAGGILQLGDAICCYSIAKILSLKHNLPFVYSNFKYHDLFKFSEIEKSDILNPIWNSNREIIYVKKDFTITKNFHNHCLFYTHLRVKIDYIDPKWIDELKKGLKLKKNPKVFDLPKNMVSIAVHIRKGNGGGEIYDGELYSLQEFDFDRNQVKYRTDFQNYPFEWRTFERKNGYYIRDIGPKIRYKEDELELNKDKILLDQAWHTQTQFPPNQFYIDQIRKIYNDLKHKILFVQLFTDDKNPKLLLNNIKNKFKNANIVFHYEANNYLNFKDRINQDLFMMSRCDVLIRGQSGFARTAELIGNHKLVLYPLTHKWEENKLIIDQIVMKGSIKKLLN